MQQQVIENGVWYVPLSDKWIDFADNSEVWAENEVCVSVRC